MVPQKRDLLAPVGVHPKPLKLALMGGYINGVSGLLRNLLKIWKVSTGIPTGFGLGWNPENCNIDHELNSKKMDYVIAHVY